MKTRSRLENKSARDIRTTGNATKCSTNVCLMYLLLFALLKMFPKRCLPKSKNSCKSRLISKSNQANVAVSVKYAYFRNVRLRTTRSSFSVSMKLKRTGSRIPNSLSLSRTLVHTYTHTHSLSFSLINYRFAHLCVKTL